MSELATLGRPYANALFDVSQEKSIDFSESLESILSVISNKEFEVYLRNPSSNKKFANNLIFDIVGEVNTELKIFVQILTENSRLFVLNEIYQQYKNLMNFSNGIKKVTIVTTFKLEDKDLKNLIKKLEAKYETKFEPEIIIDPYLIGGVRIEIDDQVLDGSVRSRIDRLKSSLLT